jgi:hypothetical protein
VTAWLEAWNAANGTSIVLADNAITRDSCQCGTCPTFEVYPLAVPGAETADGPLDLGGGLSDSTGKGVAGLVVFASAESVEFEFYPIADPVTLDGMVFGVDT